MSHTFGQSKNTFELVTDLSCSSCCSSDLISGDEQSDRTQQTPDSRSISLETAFPEDMDDIVSCLVKEEKLHLFTLESEYFLRLESQPSVASSRADSIAWILKVTELSGFQPLTAYLSISYLDRFLSACPLPEIVDGWPYRLLAVACLSLAAKMEEILVPSLIDIQMDEVVDKQVFEPKTVQRMELLVLSVLEWRLRSVTPFNFLAVFSNKVDPTGQCSGYLASQATDTILASLSDVKILHYMPSCIAAASLLCVAQKIQGMSHVDSEIAESWSDGLSRENITSCCGILHDINSVRSSMSLGTLSELHSSSPLSECSYSSSPSRKKPKLSNESWT